MSDAEPDRFGPAASGGCCAGCGLAFAAGSILFVVWLVNTIAELDLRLKPPVIDWSPEVLLLFAAAEHVLGPLLTFLTDLARLVAALAGG